MAKDKKKAASAAKMAAEQAAPEVTVEKKAEMSPEEEGILEANNFLKSKQKLSPDCKVIAANLMQKRYVDNPEVPSVVADGANIAIDALLADVMVTSIATNDDVFAMIIRRDESKYLAIQSFLGTQGITIPAYKTLPSPTQEQLKKHGVNLLPAESAIVTVSSKNVSKEVIAKKKKEIETINKKPNLDPTKVKDEAELKDSLTYIFVDSSCTIVERILKAINFMSAYLNIQAKGNKEEEEAVKNLSKEDILNKVTETIGPATFVMNGLMYQPCKATNETRVPVSAFCMIKRMFETSKMFNEKMDDAFVAAVTKVLILWSCNSKIAEYKKMLDRNKATIKKLEADKQKNASAIQTEGVAMRYNEAEIIGCEAIIKSVISLNFEVISSLAEDYTSEDKNSVKHKNARRIVANIIKAYHPESELSDYDEAEMLNAATIYAGKVMNLFANPDAQNINYVDAVVPELVAKKKEPKEEGAEGEESKN